MPKTAVIIGAGIAGLASALRLTAKGYEVRIFEANSYPGGKLHTKTVDGYRFDLGPSLFTMPWLVTELFELHDRNPEDYFQYSKKTNICNYFWEDGVRFNASANLEEFVTEGAKTFSESPEQIKKYLAKNQRKYELTSAIFLEKSLHKSGTYFSRETLKALLKMGEMGINKSLDSENKAYFKNPKLIQLFNRYATYNGSSPYKTPGIMSMIPHLEMGLGTYFPKGGMHSIIDSIVKLAKEIGIQFYFDKKVDEILVEHNIAKGIKCNNETFWADLIISNMDVHPTYKKLLPRQKHPKKVLQQERSSSALIFYWGISKTFPELDLHNILFSNNYNKEFEMIFDDKSLSDDPTIYINITSKEKSTDAPEGSENWFVMVNTPGNYGQNWSDIAKQVRSHIIRKINSILNTNIQQYIETEFILDPLGIEESTSSYRGSLYGAASNSKFAAFLRHPNFSSSVKNLFFCGGSVHPGGGIPLCLLSAKILTDVIPDE